MEALESLVDFVPRAGQDSMHSTLDECTAGLARMYSGHIGPVHGPQWEIQPLNQQSLGWGVEPYQPPVFEPVVFKPAEDLGVGGGSFINGSQGNIYQEYNLGDMGGVQEASGYSFTERYDFSGHDNTEPHLNQEVINNDMLNRWGLPDTIIGGGISKKSEDGFKGLGSAHSTSLWNKW